MKYFISHLISGLHKNYSHFKTRLQVRQNLDILKLDGMINSKIFLQQNTSIVRVMHLQKVFEFNLIWFIKVS